MLLVFPRSSVLHVLKTRVQFQHFKVQAWGQDFQNTRRENHRYGRGNGLLAGLDRSVAEGTGSTLLFLISAILHIGPIVRVNPDVRVFPANNAVWISDIATEECVSIKLTSSCASACVRCSAFVASRDGGGRVG